MDLHGGRALLAVPVGSCEQHGPHLPLDTDTLIARALAEALANRRQDTLVAPPIAIGASGEHSDFPGTLSLGTPVMTDVLIELARSALPEPASGHPRPFSAVLFVNAHGGNLDAFTSSMAVLTSEGRPVGVWHPRIPGGDSHAGATETSLMLHLHPELVRREAVEIGSTAHFSDISGQLTDGGLADVAPNGVLGDPTKASAAHGEQLFEELAAGLFENAAELVDH